MDHISEKIIDYVKKEVTIGNSLPFLVQGEDYIELFIYNKIPSIADIVLSYGKTVPWDTDAPRTENKKNKKEPDYESIVFNKNSTCALWLKPKDPKEKHDHKICEFIKNNWIKEDWLDEDWQTDDEKEKEKELMDHGCIGFFKITGGSSCQPPQLSDCCWECDVRDYDHTNEILYYISKGVEYYAYNLILENVKNGLNLMDFIMKKCDPELDFFDMD